jgi:hypothetical protein
MPRRLLASSQPGLDAVRFLVDAVVLVAVFREALQEALFGVVRGHDGGDGADYGGCHDELDDGDHGWFCGSGERKEVGRWVLVVDFGYRTDGAELFGQ